MNQKRRQNTEDGRQQNKVETAFLLSLDFGFYSSLIPAALIPYYPVLVRKLCYTIAS
jgi:hypothetical protein